MIDYNYSKNRLCPDCSILITNSSKRCKKCASLAMRGSHNSPYTEIKKGQHLSPDTEFKKGNISWSQGLTKETSVRVRIAAEKTSKTKKKQFKEGRLINPFKGKKHSRETKEKISKANKNNVPWSKGLTKKTDSRIKKISKALTGRKPWCTGLNKHQHPSIMKISQANSGENNPMFKDWISLEPYSRAFHNNFKERIRNRDKNKCMICNIKEIILGYQLNIHHIDYDKKNTTKENCVSLCKSCHTRTNHNRKHWKNFFCSLLSEIYGYDYSSIINQDNDSIINTNLSNFINQGVIND